MRKYYSTKKVKYNNLTFDSGLELYFYKLLEKENLLASLKMQEPFELQPTFKWQNKTIRKMEYVSDFYLADKKIVIETKGLLEEKAKIKHKLFKFKFPDHNFFMPRNQVQCREVVEEIKKIYDQLLREEGDSQQQSVSDKPRARRKPKAIPNVSGGNNTKNSSISKSRKRKPPTSVL
jgi:very-short-patch-repair endonuclease